MHDMTVDGKCSVSLCMSSPCTKDRVFIGPSRTPYPVRQLYPKNILRDRVITTPCSLQAAHTKQYTHTLHWQVGPRSHLMVDQWRASRCVVFVATSEAFASRHPSLFLDGLRGHLQSLHVSTPSALPDGCMARVAVAAPWRWSWSVSTIQRPLLDVILL